MTVHNESVRLYVYYSGPGGSRFDRAYYVDRHLKIVMDAWERYGLTSVRAFFPPEEADGTLAICECVFRDEDAIDAAFSSPEAPHVMADVPRFTDITPRQLRGLPLKEA